MEENRMRRHGCSYRSVWIAVLAALCWVPAAAADAPKTEDGRVTLWSGVSYQDLTVGTGETVRPGQVVTVHATGWLADGTKFWSSLDDGTTYEFPMRSGPGGVIPGWADGIPGMKVGGKRKLWVPSDLGYGKAGSGEIIPADADLVFEVEIFGIVKTSEVKPSEKAP